MISTDEIADAVEEVWPAPEFREHQKETIINVLKKFYQDDVEVVTLSAPTGSGKSLIIYTVGKAMSYLNNDSTFSTTPLNTLIDQIEADEFLEDVTTIKGKNNYTCVNIADRGTPVDDAICQRKTDFSCELKDKYPSNGGCPYYGKKHLAQASDVMATNLSYIMANSMIPEQEDARFEPRKLLAIDETQSIEDFALQFIGFTVSQSRIPIDLERLPPLPEESDSMDKVVSWLKELMGMVVTKHNDLSSKNTLTTEENRNKEKLQRFYHRLQNFLQDYNSGKHWTKNHDEGKIKFEPVFIGRFIGKFLWSQADKILLSSATIPKGNFAEEIGIDDKRIAEVVVPSTFPKENRPVITGEMVGKMTQFERDETIPKMGDKIQTIADHHRGQKGFIHCHSYSIAERLYDNLDPIVKRRAMLQDEEDREQSLEDWMDSTKQIFFSVGMEEGISLDDRLARWQIVAKAAYPFTQDERVDYRLNELDDWSWYANQAAIDLQQAVGRGMRSKDDWCVTYLLDSSFKTLINRNKHLFEDYFLKAVDCETHLDVYKEPSKFTFTS